MIKKDKMLEILSKYGMDLNDCAPFLYEDNNKIGVVYSFTHEYYGLLTRVFFPDNEAELETFAYQYWWYQNHAQTYEVKLELDDYNCLEVKPHFVRNEKIITSEEMRQLLIHPDYFLKEQEDDKLFQKLLRTANLLIDIMTLKNKMILDTYDHVMDLRRELVKQENEFIQLYNRYQKTNLALKDLEVKKKDDFEQQNFEEIFETFKRIQKKEDLPILKDFINMLWAQLKKMETNLKHLKNKYALTTLPMDLEVIRKKKSYLESLFNRKKSIFQKKVDPDIELKKIDEEKEKKGVISENDYIAEQTNLLSDKYSIINQDSYDTLGDYLNDFDNMGILVPNSNDNDYFQHDITHDAFLKRMKDIYENLSNHELQCLLIYHSFLEPLCDIILTQLLERVEESFIVSDLLKLRKDDVIDSMQHLGDAENVFVRMQKMRMLDLSSPETFLHSLVLACKTLMTLKRFYVPGEITVFGQSKKEDIDFLIYHANFKTTAAPIQQKGISNVHDIIKIKERVPFLFFSNYYSFRDPFFHDYTLQEEQREDILILLKDYQLNWENAAFVSVARYRMKRNGKNIIKIDLEKIDQYRYLTVSF